MSPLGNHGALLLGTQGDCPIQHQPQLQLPVDMGNPLLKSHQKGGNVLQMTVGNQLKFLLHEKPPPLLLL